MSFKTSSAFVQQSAGQPTEICAEIRVGSRRFRLNEVSGVIAIVNLKETPDPVPPEKVSPLGLAVISVLPGNPEPFSTLLTLPAGTPSVTSIVSGRSQM